MNLENQIIDFRVKLNERKRLRDRNLVPPTPQELANDDRYMKLLSLIEEQHIQISQLRNAVQSFLRLYKKHRKKDISKQLVIDPITQSITALPISTHP